MITTIENTNSTAQQPPTYNQITKLFSDIRSSVVMQNLQEALKLAASYTLNIGFAALLPMIAHLQKQNDNNIDYLSAAPLILALGNF